MAVVTRRPLPLRATVPTTVPTTVQFTGGHRRRSRPLGGRRVGERRRRRLWGVAADRFRSFAIAFTIAYVIAYVITTAVGVFACGAAACLCCATDDESQLATEVHAVREMSARRVGGGRLRLQLCGRRVTMGRNQTAAPRH